MKFSAGVNFDRQPKALEPTSAEGRIKARLDVLRGFDVTNPATTLKRVEESVTQAFKENREKDAYGWMAILAMMREEVMRDAWLVRQKKHSAQVVSEKEYGDVAGTYQGTLFHLREAPSEIIPHLPLRDLQRRLADVEANEKFYRLESSSTEQGKRAKQHLWSAFLLEVQEGKQAEIALIGILRYGLQYYRAQHASSGSASEEAALLDPALYVQGTMPREDTYQIGKFRERDLLFLLPGDSEPLALQLKTGPEAHTADRSLVYRLAVVNLAASRLIECWKKIGDPAHRMSEMEWKHWKAVYREVMEDLVEQMGKIAHEPAERVHQFFLPWQRSRSKPVVEGTTVSLDQALSLKEMNQRWPTILTLRPELEHEIGPMINLSNFTRAKQSLRTWCEREPNLPLWQGWIKNAA